MKSKILAKVLGGLSIIAGAVTLGLGALIFSCDSIEYSVTTEIEEKTNEAPEETK